MWTCSPLPAARWLATALIIAAPLFSQVRRVLPEYDQASLARGKVSFGAACGFCHGGNARGGEGGPDLLHSTIVLEDESGKQLDDFLRKGRPEKGMPAFAALNQAQAADIATFLHSEVLAAVAQLTVRVNIVTGDAKSGQAFFNGEGHCSQCHSVAGDLKGIGAKYEPIMLQDKAMSPRGATSSAGTSAGPQALVKVTLPSGEKVSGTLLRLTFFHVTLRDAQGTRHTFARNGSVPKVDVEDPLQAHIDNLLKITDKQMHDVTAYLVTLQ